MYYWWYTDWYNGHTYPRRPASVEGEAATPDPDQRLLREVADALFADPDVTGGHIDLDVQNGVVILDGEVDTEATRAAAVHRAWAVAGVTDVCDALAVTRSRRRR